MDLGLLPNLFFFCGAATPSCCALHRTHSFIRSDWIINFHSGLPLACSRNAMPPQEKAMATEAKKSTEPTAEELYGPYPSVSNSSWCALD